MEKTPTIEAVPVAKGAGFEREVFRTAKGGGILAAGRLFNFVARFVITVVMTRLLQAEQYGLYSLATSAATVAAGISKFGLDSAVMRYIAIMVSRKDKKGVWGSIQVSVGFSLLFSVLINAGLFFLAYPIAEKVFNDIRLAPLLQVTAFIAPFLSQSDVLAGATRGFKNMSDTVIAQNIIQPAARLAVVGVLAFSGLTVVEALIAYGLADLAGSIVLLYYLNKHFSLKKSFGSAERNTREILGFSMPLWVSDVMTTFQGNLQTLMIGSLGTIQGAGIFSVINQVNLLGKTFHGSINTSARPLIAELSDRKEFKNLNRLYQTTTKWIVTINLPFILTVIMFPDEILQIFGKSFEAGASALVLMAVVNLVNVSTGMCGAIVEMTGYAKLKLFNSVVRITIAIAANYLLIPPYGLLGAAMAALINEIVANLLPLIENWILFRAFPFNLTFIKPIVAASAAALVSLGAQAIIPPTGNLFIVGLHVLLLTGVYAGVILLLGLPEEERSMLVQARDKALRRFIHKENHR